MEPLLILKRVFQKRVLLPRRDMGRMTVTRGERGVMQEDVHKSVDEAEGRAGQHCRLLGKGGSGSLGSTVIEASRSLPREVVAGRRRAGTRPGAGLGTITVAGSEGPEAWGQEAEEGHQGCPPWWGQK